MAFKDVRRQKFLDEKTIVSWMSNWPTIFKGVTRSWQTVPSLLTRQCSVSVGRRPLMGCNN